MFRSRPCATEETETSQVISVKSISSLQLFHPELECLIRDAWMSSTLIFSRLGRPVFLLPIALVPLAPRTGELQHDMGSGSGTPNSVPSH